VRWREVTSRPLIRCEHVWVVFGRGDAAVTALRDANLDVGEGESVALTGPSGSGKTTLLQVLAGLVAPSSGRVVLADADLGDLGFDERARQRARNLGYVSQEPGLFPTLSTLENVAFAGWLARRAGVDRPTRRPEELLELVGLCDHRHHLPGELSGGEAQRVAIARALALAPRILLCDEPTGQLDRDTGERVLDLLDALRAEHGFGLVVSTHDPDIAARAQRLVLLEDGSMVVSEVNA
jgi:putative ABC transport system ATP-binding protein